MKNNPALRIAMWRILLSAIVCVMCLTACERKPLYLQADGNVIVETSIYDIELNLLWGLDWRTEWQYEWDEAKYGPIGYSEPAGVRATIYSLGSDLSRENFFTQNFSVEGGRVTLKGGNWYDMLFYNNGTEYILFNTDEDYLYYMASTRASTRTAYSPTTRTRAYVDMNQPDEFFGTFIEKNEVSLNPEDYEIEYDENGHTIYVYTLDAVLRPHTMIYLVQFMVINNINDKGERIVKGAKGLTLSGMANEVNLFSRVNSDSIISLTTDDIKLLQTDRKLRLPDGTTQQGDVMAARMLTWGLPSIDPLAGTAMASETAVNDSCYIGVGLTLRNGAVYTVQENVTDQFCVRPSGGVITIVIDAATLPEPPEPSPGGGGFDASVDDWENEVNADIII